MVYKHYVINNKFLETFIKFKKKIKKMLKERQGLLHLWLHLNSSVVFLNI